MNIKFTIPGPPQGKGRHKTVRLKNGASHTYTPTQAAIYENLVRLEYQKSARRTGTPGRAGHEVADQPRVGAADSCEAGTPRQCGLAATCGGCSPMHPGTHRFDEGEALGLIVEAYFAIPMSASRKKREGMLAGTLRPTGKPDLDNVLKVVADSLNGIAYRDDAQIAWAMVTKLYSDRPRVEVTLRSGNEG